MKEERLVELKDLSVIVVDDNTDLLQSLKKILGIFFKEVFSAKNGKEGLDIFNKERIDLVITDYVMPVMSGYDLVKEIRKEDKKTPIVIMSSHSEKDKLLNAIPLDLVNYLIKPLDYSTIIETLINFIEKAEKHNLIIQKLPYGYSYNKKAKELIYADEVITLTKSERDLLHILVENIGIPISRVEISQKLSTDGKYRTEQAVKNILIRLKLKFKENDIINTSAKVGGYILEKP
ncbi:response regulator with CheY-like receiver domain and winged-helix DNA-binding domain [Thiovulum sp. ES]|nr:response regulator with CheY-like receiver domain and winged-helix DNA-binding domain [Thiovulum sp. ES]